MTVSLTPTAASFTYVADNAPAAIDVAVTASGGAGPYAFTAKEPPNTTVAAPVVDANAATFTITPPKLAGHYLVRLSATDAAEDRATIVVTLHGVHS